MIKSSDSIYIHQRSFLCRLTNLSKLKKNSDNHIMILVALTIPAVIKALAPTAPLIAKLIIKNYYKKLIPSSKIITLSSLLMILLLMTSLINHNTLYFLYICPTSYLLIQNNTLVWFLYRNSYMSL